MTDDDKKLVERLRKTFHKGIPVNPDGPEAADRIEALNAEIARLKGALETLMRYFVDSDEEGLAEHAEPIILARAALGGNDE